MTEHEENIVHTLLDRCDENGSVLIKKEDMELILKHQRELGVEEGKGCLEQIRWERDVAISQLEDVGASFGLKMSLWLDEHDKEVRRKAVEEGKKAMREILQRLDTNINMDFSKETFGFHFDTTSYKYGLIDAKNIIKEKHDSLI